MLKILLSADTIYPLVSKRINYGTAGFRTLGEYLDRVCFRTGILAAIRAKMRGLGGVMITASHNPKQDNGVKIIERDGSMLEPKWEKLAEDLVNAPDLSEYLQ
jgi:phosphoacetylglucosamine mutase